MSRKIAICPHCGTKIACEGEPDQKVVIECVNCGKKGLVSFAEKAVTDVREKERENLKRAAIEEELKRQKVELGDKEREKHRFFGLLKKIEVKRGFITTREKEREAKKAEKEKERELQEKAVEEEKLKKLELKKAMIKAKEKKRAIKKTEEEKKEKLKRQGIEQREKQREEQRLKKIEIKNALIEAKKKDKEAKIAKKEDKRKLKEKQRLKKIELKKRLTATKEKERETLRSTKKEEELKREERELKVKLRKIKIKVEKLKKLEAEKVVIKAEKAVIAAKKRKKESLRKAAKEEELKRQGEELRKKKIKEEELKKLEAEKTVIQTKEKERETLQRTEEEELKRQEVELRERAIKERIKKLEEEIAIIDVREKEREAFLRRTEKEIEEEERKEKEEEERVLKEKELREREIEDRLKKLEEEIAVIDAREKEREALLQKTGIESEEEGEVERKKEDILLGEKNFVELDFYPINEPFAYVKILKDTTSLDKYYKILEPQLMDQELNTLNLLQENLINSVDIRLDEIESSSIDRFLIDQIDQTIEDNEMKSDDILKKKFLYYVKRDFLGYGKINSLMNDPNIEDISCDGSKVPIFLYHRRYGSLKSNIKFDNEETLSIFVVKLAQKCGKHISIAEPMLDATMPDGSRIQMTLSETVTTKGSTFTIRKFRSDPITPTNLIDYNTMSPEMIAYMWMAVENGHNALIAGSTAAGKTSTLNALSLFIPKEAKIVSIEETREINLPHPNWIPGVARSGFGEVVRDKLVGEIDLFDLMKAALRQRPEYILVGEIRGREAYVLFQAMATGHTTYSTFHADSPKSVIHRLEGKPIEIPRVMLQSLDIVFIQVNAKIGDKHVRKCKQIVEIVDIDPNTKEILSNEVFRWDPVEDKFIYSGKSYIIERIRNQHGMSKEDIMQEVRRRVEVLDWMRNNNIKSFIEFAKVISFYAENPNELMKKVIDGNKIEKEESNKIDVHKIEKSDKIGVGEIDLGNDFIVEEKTSTLSAKKKIRKSIGFWRNKNNSK